MREEENVSKGSLISERVETLAMQTVMAEPDDVMGLGSIMETLESIENAELEESLKPAGVLSAALRKLVEKIILQDVPDPAGALALVRTGAAILQRKISSPASAQMAVEEESFWGQIKCLVTLDFVPGPPVREAGPSSQQATSDLAQDAELYHDFVSEALEHLSTIELKLINLEQSPGDKECINAIFRPFHTIKGVSGFLNLKSINRFAHAMESLLDDARSEKLKICREVIDFVLEAVDLLKEMIQDVKNHVDSGLLTLTPFDIDSYLDRISRLRGTASERDGGEEPEGTEMSRPLLGEILTSKGLVSAGEVEEALTEQVAGKSGMKLGEILVKKSDVKPKQIIEALREQKKATIQSGESTVKVDTQKLDNLIDLVGELVIAQSLVQSRVARDSRVNDQKMNRDLSQLRRITTDLQKISMSLRMVPIRQAFQKMIRLVRDLATKSGKRVELHMSGEETEIDRSMVDKLHDPLVHMIRNSIDHGLEPPEKRLESGKPETGSIFLRAYQKGGYIVIEVEDDGQGLNRSKILRKAQERGLVPPEASPSDYQLDNLILEPGFSTADRVTDISGRGVGTDVVKKTVEELKGKLEVFSIDGKGCRFVMRVPLTLAIMDGIVVQIGQERYIIPAVFVKETVRPNREDFATVQKKGELIKVRDTLLPLIRLHRLLGVAGREKEPWETLTVVVENDGRQKGLMVDDLIGKQEVVIKNLGESLKAVEGVAAATIMGDGRVGLILDMHGIFQIDQHP